MATKREPPSSRAAETDDGRPRSEVLERTVHDLKNPLAVVRSALEWLEVELQGREDALDAVRDATTAATRLLSIIDDLDALARLQRAGAVVAVAVDLATLIGQVAAAASIRLAGAGLSLSASAPAALPASGDADLLGRALHVLIDACARGAPSGTSIELRAWLTEDEGAALIAIEIGQQGTAAAGPETSKLDALGSGGLSVYLALQVAEAHGGSLVMIPTATMPRALMRLPL